MAQIDHGIRRTEAGDVGELPYERRLAILLRRSAERAEDVLALSTANLMRRAADCVDPATKWEAYTLYGEDD